MQRLLLAILILAGFLSRASAVEILSSAGTATYQNTEPTNTDVTNWTSGWGSSGVTGWDYVGQVNGASAVYLGNNWVITAAHVSAGDFTLNSVTYSVITQSITSFSDSLGTADLTMFQINGDPSLPSLDIATSSPTLGSSVVIVGYGGGAGETWGENTITTRSHPTSVSGYPYVSYDFETAYGTTNQAVLVGGDSGGADFIYTGSSWQLVGINEAVDGSNNSYFVQLSKYPVSTVVATPEPQTVMLMSLGLGVLVLGVGRKYLRAKRLSTP